jgi:hypothetical protein
MLKIVFGTSGCINLTFASSGKKKTDSGTANGTIFAWNVYIYITLYNCQYRYLTFLLHSLAHLGATLLKKH